MKTDKSIPAPKNGMRPVHPGEILREDYLNPLSMSANALAKALRVPPSRVNDILLERRSVTVDTAMRLVRYFGGDVQSWLNLQLAYDLGVYRILCKRVFSLKRRHAIFELNREAVQCGFPVMNRHRPFPADVI